MRLKGAAAAATLLMAMLASASPAQAASTRAEYVAQVDPICLAYDGPTDKALNAYLKSAKVWERLATKGTLKAWVRQTAKTARLLRGLVQIERSSTAQIAAVPPPPQDAGTVGTWLQYRNDAHSFAYAAANALAAFKIKRYFGLTARANAAAKASRSSITGFGFQLCGVSA